jgi:hypothetical protein
MFDETGLPEFFDEPLAGEAFEATEEGWLDVQVFTRHFRAFPPVSAGPRIQICPVCDFDCTEVERNLWVCANCGFREDNRPLIRKDMPRRKRRRKKAKP